jgi:mono/diheme cytochrome c family protein
MRYVYLATFFLVVLVVGLMGFRGSISTRPPLEVFPDMDRQPYYKPQSRSAFFADGRTDRPIPAGVVARGRLRLDSAYYEGREADGQWVRGLPERVAVTHAFMERGRERYDIYCTVCHGALGDGRGIVTQYGWGGPVSLHSDVFRDMAEGEIYNTITHGKNTMFGYGDKLEPEDRWAVVAYVRALQRAQRGRVEDVPASNRKDLGL